MAFIYFLVRVRTPNMTTTAHRVARLSFILLPGKENRTRRKSLDTAPPSPICTHLPRVQEHGHEIQEPRAEPDLQPERREEPQPEENGAVWQCVARAHGRHECRGALVT